MNIYTILVRLLLVSAALQLGLNLSRIEECASRMCIAEIQRASLQVLDIEWRPISVFPEHWRCATQKFGVDRTKLLEKINQPFERCNYEVNR